MLFNQTEIKDKRPFISQECDSWFMEIVETESTFCINMKTFFSSGPGINTYLEKNLMYPISKKENDAKAFVNCYMATLKEHSLTKVVDFGVCYDNAILKSAVKAPKKR